MEERTPDPIQYVSWDYRPAIILEPGVAFAILVKGGPWTQVDYLDVCHTGGVITKEEFRSWGPFPPLPRPPYREMWTWDAPR